MIVGLLITIYSVCEFLNRFIAHVLQKTLRKKGSSLTYIYYFYFLWLSTLLIYLGISSPYSHYLSELYVSCTYRYI